jgi:putative transposase
VKYEFIAKHRSVWPVTWICDVLGVSRSGFYEWLERPLSPRSVEDRTILAEIKMSHERSGGSYGVRRVWPDVVEAGFEVGRERIARIMRSAGIRGDVPKKRRPKDVGQRPAHPLADNILSRDFTADAPNRRWVADFTHVWTREGWLYVATILDLFSTRIVGWSMKANMTAELVIDALQMAIWRRGIPKKLLHHSDQGSQYTSEPFQRMLRDLGIECSLSRRGECHDNAVMESFYGSMKTEKLYREKYKTRHEAKAAVFDYIEGFYNPHRRHSTLGNISPAAFEKQALRA